MKNCSRLRSLRMGKNALRRYERPIRKERPRPSLRSVSGERVIGKSKNRRVEKKSRVATHIGISLCTFSVTGPYLFSRSSRKRRKRESEHFAMLRNNETRNRQ